MSLLPQAVMSGLISGTVYALLAMGLIIAAGSVRAKPFPPGVALQLGSNACRREGISQAFFHKR